MDAIELFKESLKWFKDNYGCYFTERDIVLTVQQSLNRTIEERRLPYKVFNDYPMIPGPRRSLCADLVIMNKDEDENDKNTRVEIAVEFKYEPDHHRIDLLKSKFKPTVIFWKEGVGKDIMRVNDFVNRGKSKEGCFILVDEGKYFYDRYKSKNESYNNCWEERGSKAFLICWANKCNP